MQAPQPPLPLDLRPCPQGEKHQPGERHTCPVMGLPEGGREGVIRQPPDLRLSTEQQHPGPAEQRKTQPSCRRTAAPERQQAAQRSEQHQQQLRCPHRPACKPIRRHLGGDHHGEGREHQQHHPGRQPTAQITVGTSGTRRSFAPDRPGQPHHHSKQWIDHDHGQGRMQDPEPVGCRHVRIIDQRSTTALCSDHRFPAARRGNRRLLQLPMPTQVPVFLETAKHDRGEHASHQHREHLLQHVKEEKRRMGSDQPGVTDPEFIPGQGLGSSLFWQGGPWLQNRFWSDARSGLRHQLQNRSVAFHTNHESWICVYLTDDKCFAKMATNPPD